MPTRTLRIGSGTGTPDHTSIGSLESALGYSWSDIEVSELWNETAANEIIGRLWHGGTQNGHKHIIRPRTGDGKSSHASKATNAQAFNNGVGCSWSNSGDRCIVNSSGPVEIFDVQFSGSGAGEVLNFYSTAGDVLLERCIVSGSGTRGLIYTERGGSSTIELRSSLVISNGSNGLRFYNNGGTQVLNLVDSVIVQIGTVGSTIGIHHDTAGGGGAFSGVLANAAVAGFNTDSNWSGYTTGDSCATDKSAGTTGMPPTGRQTDLVMATEWENATSDFRRKATAVKLKDTGNASYGVNTDNVGQTRPSGVAKDIGQFELQEAATIALSAMRGVFQMRGARP